MTNSAPEIKAKFDTPDFVENNEEMLKDEFIKYFQVMFFFGSTQSVFQQNNGISCTEHYVEFCFRLSKTLLILLTERA